MLARQAFLLGRGAWKKAGTVLYLLAAAGGTTDKQPKTSGLSAQRQHKAENAAKAGNTRWNDNGNGPVTGPFLLLCSPIQFTAFPCLWQKDRQSMRETGTILPQRKFNELL